MKISIVCLIALCVATAILVLVGQSPTEARWGAEGVASLRAVAVICLASAFAGLLPIALVAAKWPSYLGQAALGGTAIRLLLTMAIGLQSYFFKQEHFEDTRRITIWRFCSRNYNIRIYHHFYHF